MPWTKLVADQVSQNTALQDVENERILSYGQAISEAINQAMQLDQNVIVLGQGVDTPGYVYNTTLSLSKKYGQYRVIETPIAEAAMTGIVLGAALAGLRPILIHMRNDFILISMDQIINHISHWKRVFGDDVPLVIRAIIARGWGSGAQHSQNFHSLFAKFEGLAVVVPYTPYDVKGLFLSAVASDKPVLFFEHRWLYQDRGYVPEKPYTIPIGKAILRSEGLDLTIIGISLTNRDIFLALKDLKDERVTADWIDLRSTSPLDMELINSSVKKTGRLLVVEDGPMNCGISAEIAARVTEQGWNYLKTPVLRVGWNGTTVPAGTKLEAMFFPGVDNIKHSVRQLVNYK